MKLLVLACVLAATAIAQSRLPRTPAGFPDLEGIWTNATLTPLERPAALAGQATLTDSDARAYEARAWAGVDDDRRGRDPAQDLNCGPDSRFADCAGALVRLNGVARTSLIIDPPDGRVPARVPEARPPARFDSIKDRPLPERCLLGFGPSAGPPMLPGYYNSHYQIVQTPDFLMILVEMVHDVRIVRIKGTHPASQIPQWLGDSIGRWEGDTLVVDTTNFTPQTAFRGASPRLHVVERFTPTSAGTLLYRATIIDPEKFSSPWTLEYPFRRAPGPVYEYACHEDNMSIIRGILNGSR